MYTETEKRSLYRCFARMLEYPAGGTFGAALEAQSLLVGRHPEAAAQVKEFRLYVASLPPGRLEEVYTGTFDLDAACHPYVGYHLFGETYKRSIFLVELKGRYGAEGFTFPENELPDHLAVILHFLAVTRDQNLAQELVRDALLPVLDRMTGRARSAGFDEEAGAPEAQETPGGRTPFQDVLEALRSVLQKQIPSPNIPGLTALQPPSDAAQQGACPEHAHGGHDVR